MVILCQNEFAPWMIKLDFFQMANRINVSNLYGIPCPGETARPWPPLRVQEKTYSCVGAIPMDNTPKENNNEYGFGLIHTCSGKEIIKKFKALLVTD